MRPVLGPIASTGRVGEGCFFTPQLLQASFGCEVDIIAWGLPLRVHVQMKLQTFGNPHTEASAHALCRGLSARMCETVFRSAAKLRAVPGVPGPLPCSLR